MVLMSRVKDTAKIGLDMGAYECGSVHHLGDVLKSLADFDVIDYRWDRWKGAQDLGDRFANFEGFVMLRIEGVRGSHATSHPQDDDRIGFGSWVDDLGAIGHCVKQLRTSHSKRCRCSNREGF
jgi:hypothetical protein